MNKKIEDEPKKKFNRLYFWEDNIVNIWLD